MKINLKAIGLVSIAAAVGIFFIYKYNQNKKNRRRKPNQQPNQPSRPTLPEDVELVPNIDIDGLVLDPRNPRPQQPNVATPEPPTQPSRPLPNIGNLELGPVFQTER